MWSSPEDKKAQWKPRPRTFGLGQSGLCSLCTSPYIGLLLLPMLAFLPPFFILGITATKCHNLSTPGPFRDLYFPYFGPNFQKKKSDRLSSFMRARLQMSVAAIVEPVDWQLQIARPLQSSLSNWARVWAGDASGSQGLAFFLSCHLFSQFSFIVVGQGRSTKLLGRADIQQQNELLFLLLYSYLQSLPQFSLRREKSQNLLPRPATDGWFLFLSGWEYRGRWLSYIVFPPLKKPQRHSLVSMVVSFL